MTEHLFPSETIASSDRSQAAARRRLAAKRAALISARQEHPNESVTPAMMTKHYETALQFFHQLDAGKLGTTIEDQAGALTVVLAGAVAGDRAAREEEIRAGLKTIVDDCAFACDDEAPMTSTRNAVRLAVGVATRLLRATELPGEPSKESNG
jgi:hypothetical protein